MTQQSVHSNISNECYQERIQELAQSCDNEYYMSVSTTNKRRATKGRIRILEALEEFKKFQQHTKCFACLEEIKSQMTLQQEGLKEIEQVWKF